MLHSLQHLPFLRANTIQQHHPFTTIHPPAHFRLTKPLFESTSTTGTMSLRRARVSYASGQSRRIVSDSETSSQAAARVAARVAELVEPFPKAPGSEKPMALPLSSAPYGRTSHSRPLTPANPVVATRSGQFLLETPFIYDSRVPPPSNPPTNLSAPSHSAEYSIEPHPTQTTPPIQDSGPATLRASSSPDSGDIGRDRLSNTSRTPELPTAATTRLPHTPVVRLPLVAAKRLPTPPAVESPPPTAAKRFPQNPCAVEYLPITAQRTPSISSTTERPAVIAKQLPNLRPAAILSPTRTKRIPSIPSALERAPSESKQCAVIHPSRYNMALIHAKVKSVLSGDSLILSSTTNPDLERTLSLAYCNSPHMRKEGDEQWAFDSRDALRQLVVGKNVQFKVLYVIPNSKREYGIVFLNDGRRLPEEMIKEGWLKLRDDAGRKEDAEEALVQLDKLRLLEATARKEDKGLWASSGGKIDVQHDMGDPQTFLNDWKGKTVKGLVERILSGDRLLMRLLISPTKHIQGMLILESNIRTSSVYGGAIFSTPFLLSSKFVTLLLID